MQEKINKTATRRHTTKEERQQQVATWEKSGLTMSEYCRQNNVSLTSLSDWKHSILGSKVQFKRIQSQPSSEMARSSNVVEIILDHRIKIRLQQVTDASLIISIAKGLMACS